MSPGRHMDTVFNPAALAEDVDLPRERREQILRAHAALEGADHWAVLGLPWNAPCEAARAAYLERVKVFHPDRYAGRRLGSFLPRIEAVFRALTMARDELADEARRAAYAKKTAPPEEFARQEARRLADEQRSAERRARLARGNPIVARAARISELFERGKASMAAGKFAQAANDFLTVAGLEPRHVEARALAEAARRKADAEKAKERYEEGLAAEALGQTASALDLVRQACALDPQSARFAAALARLAVAAGDVTGAREAAERAVRLGPREARAHEALALALHIAGEAREARKSLDRALELDPNLASARALQKKLRWSFLG